KHKIELVGFAVSLAEMQPEQLGTVAKEGASVTDLKRPLHRAAEQTGDASAVGLILLSDGQHTAGGSPLEQVAALKELNVPIYPVVTGTKTPPVDIAVTAVRAPPAVFKGAEVAVEAQMRVQGLSARAINIELHQPGRSPIKEEIHHAGADRTYSVQFQSRLDEPGQQVLTVQVPAAVEEREAANNARSVTVNVADD